MSLLKTAVKSHIPLISVYTRDTVYIDMVLKAIVGAGVKLEKGIDENGKAVSPTKGCVHYVVLDEKTDMDDALTYSRYQKAAATLIVVNPPKARNGYLNCGQLPVPKPLLKKVLLTVAPVETVDDLILSLGGCTIKEALDLCMLAMGETNSLTPASINQTRRLFFSGSQGLTLIDLTQLFYQPMPDIEAWVAKKKDLFFTAPDPRLMPRGVLFKGQPGTGKTQGAKYIAKQWSVPLYRIDVAGTKSKWVGESASNLIQGLSRLDTEEPCVVLFDEIEKVFASGNYSDAGTTTDMLSQVLWWLAEHRSRVLTVMTTNDEKKLPPELHREGRIDKAFEFVGLTEEDAPAFVAGLLKTYKIDKLPHAKIASQAVKVAYTDSHGGRVSHARLTELVNDLIASALT